MVKFGGIRRKHGADASSGIRLSRFRPLTPMNHLSSEEPSPAHVSRQVLFGPIGRDGQKRLGRSTVTVIGCGALGATLGELLARAGVGTVRLVDRDIVEPSNLGRQALYDQSDADARRPKAVALAAHMSRIAPHGKFVPNVADFRSAVADHLLLGADLILDASDNFEARYLINDWAIKHQVPWIYGACIAARGMTSVILPGETPCLRCLFPDPPGKGTTETCDTAGIIGPAATIAASLQMTEALKILVGDRDSLRRSLLSFELWPFRMLELGGADPRPVSTCPCCGQGEFPFLEGHREARTMAYCGRDAVQIIPGDERFASFEFRSAVEKLEAQYPTRVADGVAHVQVPEGTFTLFDDGRVLITGTGDEALARTIYDRYLGG